MGQLVYNYAQALFELSEEAGQVEENLDQAVQLRDFLTRSQVEEIASMASFSKEEMVQLFSDKYQVKLTDTMYSFFIQLMEAGRIGQVDEILDAFIDQVRDSLGLVYAHVKSAAPLSDEEKAKIQAMLKKKAGKDVDMIYTVDKDLIAGFYVLMGKQVFDASARGRLNDIKREAARGDSLMTDSNELIKVIKEEIKAVSHDQDFEDAGTVLTVGDGIARIYGLDRVRNGELVQFYNGEFGMALNLEENSVGAVILGSDEGIKEGDPVKLTGSMTEVPVGDGMSGRVVDALCQPIDGRGEIEADKYLPIERQAPSVIMREEVNEPLETGIKAIDALVPIGKGQRELIIGDRQTGKTAIGIDAILNQKGKDVRCVYVAIGQKASTVARIYNSLQEAGAMDYTTIVFAGASDSSPLQYIAPYAGCSLAEYWMEKGEDVLIVYDDLSKHAVAYRTISLLLGRPPGREAYPGDVFYLHSRLLERAAKMDDNYGGGSLTALPIVETQEGDISAYIPTNVISITDGQIFLEADLFNNGIRPAINPGLSVSRVGGSAQHPIMQKLAGPLRIEYAQFNELAAFSQFGSDLNPETQAQLNHGERIREVLKQFQYDPYDMSSQIIILYALNKGAMDDIDLSRINKFEKSLIRKADKYDPSLRDDIYQADRLDEDLEVRIDRVIDLAREREFKIHEEERAR